MKFPLTLPVLLAFALAAVALFHGRRGLYETTEGRYAECAREMAQTGAWFEPVLDGEPHWTKPPLTYWAIGVPCQIFGPTTWAARLYLIPCFLVTVASVWWLAFRLWNDRPSARMSAMVFAGAAMPLISTQAVSTDYLLTASLALAQASFWEGVRRHSRLAMHAFWLCMGLAFLVKGPPALLIVPAVAAVWLRLPREERRTIPLFAPTALIVFAFAGCSWYMWESWKHSGLLSYWWRDEVVNRSLSTKYNRNPEFYHTFTIYLPILVLGSLPWCGWLVFRWCEVWRRLRVPGGVHGFLRGLSAPAYWLLWAFFLPLAVFSLSESKLPLYVLPLFVPLAAAIGRLLTVVYANTPWFRKWALASLMVMFGCFVVGKVIAARSPQRKNMAQLYHCLTTEEGIRDPSRLGTVFGHSLNGLCYYYNTVLTNMNVTDLSSWVTDGGDRFLLCGQHTADEIRQALPACKITERKIMLHYSLLCMTRRNTRNDTGK